MMRAYEGIDYEEMGIDRLTAIVQEHYWEEYREYISEVPMSAHERGLLRKWVSNGHSVYEAPESRYLPTDCYPRPFLDVYREDREISKALRGKTPEEKISWMKDYQGHTEPTITRTERECERSTVHEMARDQTRQIRRELAHLWEFIWSEGLGEEAQDFINERREVETPFEW